MNTLVTLVKREFWEHKTSFIKIPIVVGAIVVLLAVCSLIFMITGLHVPSGFMSGHHQVTPEMVRVMFYSGGIPFIIVMWLIIANYFLGCLYDDRKDKSILFWQSMPITETQTVISKIIAGLIVAPICTLVVMLVTQIILMLIDNAWLMFMHVQGISNLWNIGSMLLAIFSEIFSMIQQILWLLPFVAWFMCVSAYSKKAPFLRAIVPGIVILILESFFSHRHYFAKFVGTHIVNATIAWAPAFDFKNAQLHGYFSSLVNDLQTTNHISLLAGILIAVVGFILAIVIRNKSENL